MVTSTSSSVQYEQYACNYVQGISVQQNTRYNVGLTFPPIAHSTLATIWYQTLAQLGVHNQVGLARVSGNEQAARPVILRQPIQIGGKVKLSLTQPTLEPRNGRSLSDLVEDGLYPVEVLSALGPANLFLYQEEKDPSKASALTINLNAALWDTVTIKLVLESMLVNLQRLQKIATGATPDIKPSYTELGGWLQILYSSLPESPPEPMFLPIGTSGEEKEIPNLCISDILGATDNISSNKERRLVFQINAETVAKVELVCASKGLTLFEWNSACLVWVLARTFFEQDSHNFYAATIRQSLVLDPRDVLLPKDSPTNFLHAIGILIHGRTYLRNEITDTEHTIECILQEATRIQKDVSERLDRGEGSYETIQRMMGQRYDTSPPSPSLFEIVDNGLYQTVADDYEVEIGHRLDASEKMNIVCHQETGTGNWKQQIQLAEKQDRENTILFMEKVVALWDGLAEKHIPP